MSDQNNLDVNIPPKIPFMNRAHPILTIIIIIAITFILASLISEIKEEQFFEKKEYQVTLSVTGTAHAASITYTNGNDGIEQINAVKLPWQKTFNCKGTTNFYLSAQNLYLEGTIITTILHNNEIIRTAESQGQYVIASTKAEFNE
jgi:heme/copper-type cytochrome/quinol oxidase subunit 2